MSGFGFGSSQGANPFGSQSNAGGSSAGTGGFGFGGSQTQPSTQGFGGAPSSSFGGTAPFGQPQTPNVQPFGISAPQPQSATTFGASTNVVHSTSFGQPNPSNMNPGFGNAGTAAQGFGGTTSNSAFGTPQTSTFNDSHVANPFGISSANSGTTSTGLTFGASSNVVTNNNQGGFSNVSGNTWGAPPSSTGLGANPFGSSTFGTSSSNDIVQNQSDNEDMADGPKIFGASQGTRLSLPRNTSPKLVTVKEDTATFDSVPAVISTNPFATGQNQKELEDKKRQKKKLEAEIEAKKKKLLERKLKKKSSSTDSLLNANAASWVPASSSSPIPSSSSPIPSSSSPIPAGASLAERNAIRFGQASKPSQTRAHLPSDIRKRLDKEQPDVHNPVTSSRKDGREDLENATSLIGTCQYMCPDDELIRRERENDIQQLEIPHPGVLHPSDWTLRNTAVKRFRRSAADYKLDVPEWVRPPDVLEKVCGYLEEWVMDRDRQGPDPRFSQNATPPSLDVYQFIWDRSRMIRKDFTLQNYVGTGGKCDARAVRCHERIARWHAMCEHQLSHIPEFTKNQSQQNIQELGQAMKTLNQFYDDSLNRSCVEVPDENGNETRPDVQSSHGCNSDIVQGNNPVDFDGSPMNNDANNPLVSKRLIGRHAAKHPSHGTAEPEMRGLYILLTIDNDGGSEVLKYAARLFKERPAVYHSRPVQLALSIYKAKKEYNYARFFSILRSPSTPYLFCCVMFKNVEWMRKIALRIMSKAFGAFKKDTGEAMYDAYPLKTLTELLCFEDLEEARSACKHYNITVKPVEIKSSSQPGTKVVDVIFWKKSEFKIPKDPQKGHEIRLQPWKMNRTVECKLNGATRLAVCRGEVSGEGASVLTPVSPQSFPQVSNDTVDAEERAKLASLLQKQKIEKARLEKEAEAKRKQELDRLKVEEAKRQERLEKRRLEKIRELELKKEEEKAIREKEMKERREAEERKRLEREAEIARKEEERRVREAEERRLHLENEARKRREQEEQQRRKEEQRRELERQKLLAEEERKKRIEEEKRRKKAEAKRLEILRLELEARRRREAEERRRAKAWRDRVDLARRVLVWRRWRRRLSRQVEMTQGSKCSLRDIDPTYSSDGFRIRESLQIAFAESVSASKNKTSLTSLNGADARRLIQNLIRFKGSHISLSAMSVNEINLSPFFERSFGSDVKSGYARKSTFLLKVAVIIPASSKDLEDESMSDLIRVWINSRLNFGKVDIKCAEGSKAFFEIRSVVVLANSMKRCSDCDVALFVIPPRWLLRHRHELGPSSVCIGDDVPRVVLFLGEDDDKTNYDTSNKLLAQTFGGNTTKISIIYTSNLSTDAYDNALELACQKVAHCFVHENCVRINRVPLLELGCMTILASLWRAIPLDDKNDELLILEYSKSALLALVEEIDSQRKTNQEVWLSWPPKDFADENSDSIIGYFSNSDYLPVDWIESLRQEKIEVAISTLLHDLNGSFREVIERLLVDAPLSIQEACQSMIAKNQYRRCLERSLRWKQTSTKRISEPHFLYLPHGLLDDLVQGAVERVIDDIAASKLKVTPELLHPPNMDNPNSISGFGAINYEERLGQSSSTLSETYNVDVDCNEMIGDANSRVLSNKRQIARTSELSKRKGSLTDDWEASSPRTKRKRKEPRELSTDLADSAAFSKELEGLLQGGTIDYEVGDVMLSSLLRGIPSIKS